MPIHDNFGTGSYLTKEMFGNDGTTNYKIGKVYDNDGTVSSLVYSAAELIQDAFSGRVYGQSGVNNKSTTIYGKAFDATEYQTLTITSVLSGSENNNGNGGCDNYVRYTGAASNEYGYKVGSGGTVEYTFDISQISGVITPSVRFSCYTAWTSNTVYSDVNARFTAIPK